MQNALDQRIPDINGQPAKVEGALLLVIAINSLLLPRMQINNDEMAFKTMRFDAMPQRLLLNTLYQDWRKIGRRSKRGMVMRPLYEMRALLQVTYRVAVDALRTTETE